MVVYLGNRCLLRKEGLIVVAVRCKRLVVHVTMFCDGSFGVVVAVRRCQRLRCARVAVIRDGCFGVVVAVRRCQRLISLDVVCLYRPGGSSNRPSSIQPIYGGA
jgi:hypothetical protein